MEVKRMLDSAYQRLQKLQHASALTFPGEKPPALAAQVADDLQNCTATIRECRIAPGDLKPSPL